MSRTLSTLAVVLLVVLAGCAGANPSAIGNGGDGGSGGGGGSGVDSTGTVHVYLSDQPNAIDQFDHLNVTITKIGFHRTGDGVRDQEREHQNETETAETETAETETAENETTESAQVTTTNSTSNAAYAMNETQTTTTQTTEATATTTTQTTEATTQASTTTTTNATTQADTEESESENQTGGWQSYDVASVTVDLTEYRGTNATSLTNVTLPAGTYNTVFVYVSEVNGTLESGEHVNVKLPSDKLHVNKQFTVGDGQSVSYVFDITVVETGKSGKYILKPVVSESGAGAPIGQVHDRGKSGDHGKSDDRGKRGDHDERGSDRGKSAEHGPDHADDATTLNASFVGNVTPGENATVRVSKNGAPVEDATVRVNDADVGQTSADGTLTFAVPADADELSVEITVDDASVELEREFDDHGGRDDHDEQGNGRANRG